MNAKSNKRNKKLNRRRYYAHGIIADAFEKDISRKLIFSHPDKRINFPSNRSLEDFDTKTKRWISWMVRIQGYQVQVTIV